MPWQNVEAWDSALEESGDTYVGGEAPTDGRPNSEFLARPEQLLCDLTVWTSPRNALEDEVRGRLQDAGASELTGDDPRSGTADRLGLRLLSVPGDQGLELVRFARDRIADTPVAFNHVLVANPQRYGGCAPPVLLDIPTRGIPRFPGEAAGLKIAVLDTGVVEGAPFDFDPDSDIEPPSDGFAAGHGTMVAGVIARFAGAATILVKQVLSLPLGIADELEIAAALDALPSDVHVINASFGGPAADDERMLALQRALDRLPETTLVVASAGNQESVRPQYMAAFERVVGVASAAGTPPAVADYSNRGDWVALSTQGTDVETVAGPEAFVHATGTSFAAPKIAAMIMREAPSAAALRQRAGELIAAGPAIAGGGTFVDISTP